MKKRTRAHKNNTLLYFNPEKQAPSTDNPFKFRWNWFYLYKKYGIVGTGGMAAGGNVYWENICLMKGSC